MNYFTIIFVRAISNEIAKKQFNNMIEQIIKKYSDFYEGKPYTTIADKILEEETVALSHRTLRRMISEYVNSSSNCTGNIYSCGQDCTEQSNCIVNNYECCGDKGVPVCQNCPKVEVETSIYDNHDIHKVAAELCKTLEYRSFEKVGDSWNQKNTVDYFKGLENDYEEDRKGYNLYWSNQKDSTPSSFTIVESRNKVLDIPKHLREYPILPSECYKVLQPYVGNPDNVLVIGDPHAPFTKKGYREHCRAIQERFDCGQVVFIGDIIDSHYSSFHAQDPDGYGAGEELERAIVEIKEWHRLFPNAKVTLGNHDLIIMRKAFASGLSSKWIKGLGEVLETPTWEYAMSFVIHDVFYTHTLGGRLINAAINRRQSVVAGHLHTQANIEFNVSNKDRIFSMQVGCGIDDEAYAFSYAKLNAKKSIISCGVVLDKGNTPIILPMNL